MGHLVSRLVLIGFRDQGRPFTTGPVADRGRWWRAIWRAAARLFGRRAGQ